MLISAQLINTAFSICEAVLSSEKAMQTPLEFLHQGSKGYNKSVVITTA